jgi:riboflavin transporter FmnP
MTSLLSSVSGQFTKSLLLGTFLPVVVFVVLGLAIGLPLYKEELVVMKAGQRHFVEKNLAKAREYDL